MSHTAKWVSKTKPALPLDALTAVKCEHYAASCVECSAPCAARARSCLSMSLKWQLLPTLPWFLPWKHSPFYSPKGHLGARRRTQETLGTRTT